ncbi:MAG: NADH-quinone oxidoreductase subunit J [Pseudonocardiaceae bacterium]|nr:NADH-quinone oxidoreductase subunit J [Pseudonocardiaceae bacterium]
MSSLAALLAQAPADPSGAVGAGEAIAFWILGPVALAGGLAMVIARNAVHSALWLVLTMLCLGAMYIAQRAPFLGFVQIIVYTGAVMMLFLFVLMLVGRDSSDSVVEVLRRQRFVAMLVGLGFAALLVSALARSLTQVTPAGIAPSNVGPGGNPGSIGRALYTDYVYAFELTAVLLIVATVGAMVLGYSERNRDRPTQREMVEARIRGQQGRPSPLPGPGVFATGNSVATPALLPDGSVAPESVSEIIESITRDKLRDEVRSGQEVEPDFGARALHRPEPPTGSDQEVSPDREAGR